MQRRSTKVIRNFFGRFLVRKRRFFRYPKKKIFNTYRAHRRFYYFSPVKRDINKSSSVLTSRMFSCALKKRILMIRLRLMRRLLRKSKVRFKNLLGKKKRFYRYLRTRTSRQRLRRKKKFILRSAWLSGRIFNARSRYKLYKKFIVSADSNLGRISRLAAYFLGRQRFLRAKTIRRVRSSVSAGLLFRKYKHLNINLLTTKTNTFITITTFTRGSILFSITPKRLDRKLYCNTIKRTTWAAEEAVKRTSRWLSAYTKVENRKIRQARASRSKKNNLVRRSIFIVNLYGPKVWLQKRMCKLLFNTNKFLYFAYIRQKQSTPHNGTPFQIRKRKKNKGWNKWVKRQCRL